MASSLQFTLTVPALPEFPSVLGITASDATWIIVITLLTGTIGTPVVSRMADIYGRRRMLLVSIGLLCVGSIIAAAGMTFTTVLIGRALQGFASAIVPIGISLIRSQVERKQANMGIALMSATVGLGSALGLPLSGVLLAWGGLPLIFWGSAVASALFFCAILVVVPEAPERLNRRFDVIGAILLAVWLTALLLVVSKGTEWGVRSAETILAAAVTLAVFGIWILFSLRSRHPLIDLRLATRPRMMRINLATFFAALGMFANHLLTVQEARAPISTGYGLGLPAITAGLVLLPFAITMVALSPVSGRALNQIGPRATLVGGALIMTAGFLFRVLAPHQLGTVVIGAVVIGAGTSFAFAAMPALVTEAAPLTEVASANGVNGLIRSLSGAICGAALAFLLGSFPDANVNGALSQQGLTTAFAVVAASCLLGALIAAAPIPRRYR
nr:MFS transporter [Leifsonia psychrotolerans]